MTSVAPSMIPEVGTQIGAYTVVREVGRGGMATILEAIHRDAEEVRAIRLMLPGSHEEEVIQRFKLEFDILSRLENPGVTREFDTGMYGDRPFIVMELLHGVELGDAVD